MHFLTPCKTERSGTSLRVYLTWLQPSLLELPNIFAKSMSLVLKRCAVTYLPFNILWPPTLLGSAKPVWTTPSSTMSCVMLDLRYVNQGVPKKSQNLTKKKLVNILVKNVVKCFFFKSYRKSSMELSRKGPCLTKKNMPTSLNYCTRVILLPPV